MSSSTQNYKDESLVKPLYIRVENMESPRTYNKVANQYIINTDDGVYFQSYQTVIAFKKRETGQMYLDRNSWDYSRTTMKYLNVFLDNAAGKREIENRIKNGTYKLVDLN